MAGTESSAHQLPVLVTSLQSRVGQHGRYREQRSPVAFLVTSLQMRVGQNGRYREQRSPVAIPSHQSRSKLQMELRGRNFVVTNKEKNLFELKSSSMQGVSRECGEVEAEWSQAVNFFTG